MPKSKLKFNIDRFPRWVQSIFELNESKDQTSNLDYYIQGSLPTRVTFDDALSIPPIRSAVDWIARSLTHLTLNLVNENGEKVDNAASKRLKARKPNNFQNRSVFFAQIIEQLILNGNAYIYDDGTSMFVLDGRTENVGIGINANGFPVYTISRSMMHIGSAENVTYDANQIIHIAKNSSDGVRGIGALVELSSTLAMLLKTYHRVETLLDENNRQLIYSSDLEPIPLKAKMKQLTKMLRMPGQKLIGMGLGETLTTVESLSGIDANLIANIDRGTKEIGAYFGMPADFFNVGNSKYNNLRQSSAAFAASTLEPLAELIAEAFAVHFNIKDSNKFEFDINAFIRGDVTNHTSNVISRKNALIISVNEARDELGLPPTDNPLDDIIGLAPETIDEDEAEPDDEDVEDDEPDDETTPPTGGEDGPTPERETQ